MADRYLLGHLSAAETQAFEEHYFGCPKCAPVLEEALGHAAVASEGLIGIPERAGIGVEMDEGGARKAQVPNTPWFDPSRG